MGELEDFNAVTVEQMDTSEIYYSIPKALIEDEKYAKLRMDSKLMYAILKDRLKLSIRNGWVDDFGRPYLEYSNRELQELFNCSKNTVITIRKNLADHNLIFEMAQFTKADGQVSNRIYLGNVIRYDAEKIRQRRAQRQAEAFEKRQSKKMNAPSLKNERGELKKSTEAVQDLDTNKYLSSKIYSNKDNNSSRKANQISKEISSPAGAMNLSTQEESVKYIQPEYYSLLQVIADRYNGKFTQLDLFTGKFQNYKLTHYQKMMIGQYLSDGYVTSGEVLDIIERIPIDSESPLAYLLKCLENLKEERRLEAKMIAHRNAEMKYEDSRNYHTCLR